MAETRLWGSQGANTQAIDTALEVAVGKTQSLVHLAQPMVIGGIYQLFPQAMLQEAYDRGSLVMLDYATWDLRDQLNPAYNLDTIIAGKHDAALHAWAAAAAAWRHPFMFRPDAEMNGFWAGVPWGNQPDKYVSAWRKLRGIFRSEGATNVTWLWCPNVCAPPGSPYSTATDRLAAYYVGDDCDWTGFDSYNWGPGQKNGPWMMPSQILSGYSGWLGDTVSTILNFAPKKPMAIGETGCWDTGGDRPAWLLDLFATVPTLFPQIAAVCYFNWDASAGKRWPLTDAPSLTAFAKAIASPIWLPAGVWMPPDGQPFGAPDLVLEPQRPGLADELATATAQIATDAAELADLTDRLNVANQAADTARARLSEVQEHLQALVQLGAMTVSI